MKYSHETAKMVQDSETFKIEKRYQTVNAEGTWTFIRDNRVLVSTEVVGLKYLLDYVKTLGVEKKSNLSFLF